MWLAIKRTPEPVAAVALQAGGELYLLRGLRPAERHVHRGAAVVDARRHLFLDLWQFMR